MPEGIGYLDKKISDGKDNYSCPICHEFTCHDEWADDNSCIDCGPIPTESANVFIDNHIK